MPEFNAVENTLFIPMLGRIYASEHFPNILYDEKALSLKDVLPKSLVETDSQSQYTMLASASRSANMDRYIRDFLRRNREALLPTYRQDRAKDLHKTQHERIRPILHGEDDACVLKQEGFR